MVGKKLSIIDVDNRVSNISEEVQDLKDDLRYGIEVTRQWQFEYNDNWFLFASISILSTLVVTTLLVVAIRMEDINSAKGLLLCYIFPLACLCFGLLCANNGLVAKR